MKKGFVHFYLFLLVSLTWIGSLSAQGCCAGAAPISSNLNLASAERGSFTFDLIYDYNRLADQVDGRRELDDKLRSRLTYNLFLRLKYAFSNRWSVILMPSLTRQIERNQSPAIGIPGSEVSTHGLGDLITLVQYQVYQSADQDVLLAGGLKWPLGNTGRRHPDTDLVLHPDLQPGTGSYDFLGIVYYGKNHFLWTANRLNLTASYKVSTTTDRFNGRQTYRFGNELFVDAGMSTPIVLGNSIAYPELAVRYRHQSPATTNDQPTPFTGGHWVYLTPGFKLAPHPKWAVYGFCEIPVYRNLRSVQLTTSYRVGMGVQFQL